MEPKVLEFIETLSKDERSILKNAFCQQIEYYFDDRNNLRQINEEESEKFNYLATVLKKLGPFEKIPENGIAYYGRPAWVTPDLLNNLIGEAEERRFEPLEKIDHFLGCGGYHADILADSDELKTFVEKVIGHKVKSTGIASYLYYDRPGSGIKPHVDTDVFSINLILMLKHQHDKDKEASATGIFPANSPPEYYRLDIGEVMIMFGSSVIHTRTVIQENEIVHLLTIGFNPLD